MPNEDRSEQAHKLAHGQVCYLQIPASDTAHSIAFYESLFGWHVERPYPSFESPGLIGQWITESKSAAQGGFIFWINVDNLDEVLEKVPTAGGAIVDPPYPDAPRRLATVRDPAGNLLGLAKHQPS